jgi:hypothetical protein
MKNGISFIFMLFFANNFCYSQKISDKYFENVIEITDKNVVTNGSDFLFDVAISDDSKTPIVFVSAKVSQKLLLGIYPEFSRIIVISPNWNYYNENSKQKLPEGVICAEPIASSVIYEFKRQNGKTLKDSLVLMGDFPKMKIVSPPKIKANQTLLYFTEKFGSRCCPKDLQWENSPKREEFIVNFESENKVKIGNTYVEYTGKEGESNYYYTLNRLSNESKLRFILERNFYRIVNRNLKDIIKYPRIFTPTILEVTTKLKKI